MGSTRRRYVGLSAALGGALATACGGPAAPAQPAQSVAPVTLVWMTDWFDDQTRAGTVRDSITAYKERRPHVTVDPINPKASGYVGAASTFNHFTAGTIGEVVLPSSSVIHALADLGAFMDIAPHLKRMKFDRESVFYEPLYVEYKGKTFGLPYQLSVAAWVYNKTLFDKDGVRPPTDAWTSDDLLEAGKRLSRPAEGVYGIQMKQEWNWWYQWLYANNTDYATDAVPPRTTLDDPRAVAVLQYVVDLVQRHKVAAPEYGPNKLAAGPNFATGGVAITNNVRPKQLHSTIRDQFQWDLMPTPRWAGTKKRVTVWNHQPHVVTRVAEERGKGDEAVYLATWLCGEEGQSFVAREASYVPVNRKAATGPLYLDGSPPGLKLLLDQLTTARGDQSARGYRIWNGYSEWLSAVNPILNQAFGGEIAAQQAATQATQAGNAAIK